MTRKKRAPDLTEESILKIIELIDDWNGALTWDKLIEKIEDAIGYSYSRFTLYEYPSIANAFAIKKDSIRRKKEGNSRKFSTPRDERLAAALEQVERYKRKLERLENENNLLLEQFVRWAYNAQNKGISMRMLNEPLPKPERGKSNAA